MLFEKVNFAKFSIEPDEIMRSLPQYKPMFWERDWEIVCIPNGDKQTVIQWALEYAQSPYDIISVPATDELLVAFEDETEAMLLKISYTEKSKNVF